MIRLEPGNMLEVLPILLDMGAQFDACVTDPPYHLTSTVQRFGSATAAPAAPGVYGRSSRGFMGKEWDGGDIAFRPETWRAVWDVLKPGAYLLAFGGTRTVHRVAVAIEDAGFEIRDQMVWMYGTGFPKSHDVSKGIDKAAGAVREVVGPGRRHGGGVVGAGTSYELSPVVPPITAPATPESARWAGWGTALKPAFEPIIIARKPLIGTIAANVLAHGTGALNIDGCRIPANDKTPAPVGQYGGSAIGPSGHSGVRDGSADSLGRWPANVIHDGSDEVLEAFAVYGDRKAGASTTGSEPPDPHALVYGKRSRVPSTSHADSGTAARFFYSAKATAVDRAGSKHPTVKPLALMRYLTRLVTQPGGHVLDPFAGSGTTLQAARDEGFSATGIEMDPEYQNDIERRLSLGVWA